MSDRSADAPGASLHRTPLHDVHREIGGRLVPFAGWEMPVQYAGVLEEHMAVRQAAGMFDVSHMGEIEIEGPGALATVQRVTSNDASRLIPGRIQYSALLTARGTFVDDLLVYRRGEDRFLLVVNASNQEKDYEYIRSNAVSGTVIRFASEDWALIAVQGPRALGILQPLADADLAPVKYYAFVDGKICGAPAILSRTGYTGEDGFELYLRPEHASRVWKEIQAAGGPQGLQPAGLGARDTLRLEAKMALYGNDIDETTTPIEADLAWIVKADKGDFIGREVLKGEIERGPRRLLVGFEMVDRGIARHGYPLRVDGAEFGTVTSGSFAPFLKKNIGMAYLPREKAVPGFTFEVMVRDRALRAQVVETPFYKRPKR